MAASMAAIPGERDSSCSVAVEAGRDDDDDTMILLLLCLLWMSLLLTTLVFIMGGVVVPRGDTNALVHVTSEATIHAIEIITIVVKQPFYLLLCLSSLSVYYSSWRNMCTASYCKVQV